MTLNPAQRRWLFALFGAVLVLDYLLSSARDHEGRVLGLLGSAALLATVYLALSRPGLAALAGSVILVGSSFVPYSGPPMSLGIGDVHLPEVLAGAALVVLLAWRARPAVAGLCIAGLIVAPRAPIRFAFIAAGALGTGLVPLTLIRLDHPGSTVPSFTLTQIAASMALVAFVARQARPRPAVSATVALIAVNSTSIVDAGRSGGAGDLGAPPGFLAG